MKNESVAMRFLLLAVIACLIFANGGSASAAAGDSFSADLSTLEIKFFSHTYTDETASERLDRLDKLVFGRVRCGSDQARVTSLLMDVPNAPSAQSNPVPEEQAVPDETTPKSAPLQPEQPVAVANPTVQSDAGQSTDDYPTVTALEQRITGKTETALPLQKRLARLETVAFGKPSTSNDLSERVDQLKQYVRSKYGGDESYLASSNPVGWTGGISGLEAEVSSMEKEVFGKTYSKDNLNGRLTRLEKNLLPQQPDQSFTPIPARVSRLMTALNPSHFGAPPSTFASANSTSYTPTAQPGTSWPSMPTSEAENSNFSSGQQNVLAAAQTPNANKSKHPLLRKLGVIAGDVGGLALRSMMYGGYGYGY